MAQKARCGSESLLSFNDLFLPRLESVGVCWGLSKPIGEFWSHLFLGPVCFSHVLVGVPLKALYVSCVVSLGLKKRHLKLNLVVSGVAESLWLRVFEGLCCKGKDLLLQIQISVSQSRPAKMAYNLYTTPMSG